MYAASGGLRSSQCAPGFPTSSGGRLDSQGRMWVVTSNGLAMIGPRDIHPLAPPPAPQIRAMNVDGVPVVDRTTIVLPSDVRRVEFQYLEQSGSARRSGLRYEYKLEGLDADWISAGPRRSTDYNNLPPGDYRFVVRATLGEGISGPPTSLVFTRRAAWFEAAWFPPAVIVSLVLLGWLVYWLRLRQVRARFAVVLEERLRISRELHDTLAQGFVGISSQLNGVASALRASPAVAEERPRAGAPYDTAQPDGSAPVDHGSADVGARRAQLLVGHRPRSPHPTAGSGVSVRVDGDGESLGLDAGRQQECLRIAQEAVANAVKQAGRAPSRCRSPHSTAMRSLTGSGRRPRASTRKARSSAAAGISACSACASARGGWAATSR